MLAIVAALCSGCRDGGHGWIPRLLATRTHMPCRGTVVAVLYEDNSGPVADRYTERYRIALQGVAFERTGEKGGPINRGSWPVEIPPAAIEALFEELGAVDCRLIKEVRPDEVPVGAGWLLFAVEYQSGGRLALWYNEDVTYQRGELITQPVVAFGRGLELPEDVWSTMLETPWSPRPWRRG